MPYDLKLVAKGRRESRAALVEQGWYSVGVAKDHAERLATAGWTAEDTAGLESVVVKLESRTGEQALARGHARSELSDEQAAITEAKAYIRKLRHALTRALRRAPIKDVSEKSFAVGEALDRSTPRIIAYLDRIAPSVALLDEALKPAFDGASAAAELTRVKLNLAEADRGQETAIADIPDDTAAVYEAMGQVLELIKDLNHAAAIAFDGQATIIAKFNKDILLRSRRSRRAGETPATPATPTPTAAVC